MNQRDHSQSDHEEIRSISLGENSLYLSGSRGTLSSIDLNGGALNWAVQMDKEGAEGGAYSIVPAMEKEGLVTAVGLYWGAQVLRFDRLTGQCKQTLSFDDDRYGRAVSSAIVQGDLVSVGTTHGGLLSRNATSASRHWHFRVDGELRDDRFVTMGDLTIIGCSDGQVYGLNVPRKRKRWAFKSEGKGWATPTAQGDDSVIVTDSTSIHSLEARSGRVQWSNSTIYRSSTALTNDAVVYICTIDENQRDGLNAFDAMTGELIWRCPFPQLDAAKVPQKREAGLSTVPAG